MILTYQAVDNEGRRTSDTCEAAGPREGTELLRRRGLYVTQITEAGDRKKKASTGVSARGGVRLPIKMLVIITRQLAMMLRAGSAVVPAMTAITRQLKKPAHAMLFAEIIADLEEGLPMSEALRKHPRTFDAAYCAVVAAGEASAKLTEMFERLSVAVATQRRMRNKVIGALAYPVLLIFMCFHILLGLLFFVLPRFADMFKQLAVEVPTTTRWLLAVGSFISDEWPLLLVAAGLVVAGIVFTVVSAAGRQWMTNVQIRIPLLGPLRSRLIQGQVLRTMGTLLESGVGVLEALQLARGSTGNDRFGTLFDDIENSVTSGGRISDAFERSGLVEMHICQAIHTGEDTGNLGTAITYCADMLDETNEELVSTIMKLVEPVILIGMGFVVGGVAISLFMPLFDLTSALQ